MVVDIVGTPVPGLTVAMSDRLLPQPVPQVGGQILIDLNSNFSLLPSTGAGWDAVIPSGAADQTWYLQGVYLDQAAGFLRWTDGLTYTVCAND